MTHARRTLIVLALVVSAIVIGYVLYRDHAIARARQDAEASAQNERGRVLAELDVNDPGWRLDDIEAARAVLPEAENSAVVVRKLARILPGSVFGWNMGRKKRLFQNLAPADRLTEAQLQVLNDAIMPLVPERALALSLKDLPRGRYALKYTADFLGTDPAEALSSRVVRQFLYYDVVLRAEQGDLGGATEACQALLNAARSIGDEPMLLSQLERLMGQEQTARAVERVLAQGQAPAASLQALQQALAGECAESPLYYAVRGVRGAAERVYRAFEEDRPHSPDQAFAAHLRYLTRVVEVLKQPIARQNEAIATLEQAEHPRLPELARQLVPVLGQVVEVQVQSQASLRVALVAVAAERYRLEHKSWPKTAEDLVAVGLLKAVPVDPFDAQLIRWRLLPDGVSVYSVGPDGIDNDGLRGRPAAANTDIVIRLWNIGARRQDLPGC